MTKKIQRNEIRSRLASLNPEYCRNTDMAICNTLLALDAYQNASCIFCYISIGKEVNTTPLLQSAWKSGKRIAVPKCIGNGIMELFLIDSYEDLEPGSYGIPEPKSCCVPADISEIDLGVIPCLSCDRNRHRLGHGGGYYDRYLQKASFPTICLCRESLLLDQVCCEAHDVMADMVITENAVYK